MRHALRRLTRVIAVASAGLWAFRQRHILSSALRFAKTAPTRVRLGATKDLALATTVHWALLRDDRLHGANVRVCSVEGGTVVLGAPASETRAAMAREVVRAVPGVEDVRLEDPSATAAPDIGGAPVWGEASTTADVATSAGGSP